MIPTKANRVDSERGGGVAVTTDAFAKSRRHSKNFSSLPLFAAVLLATFSSAASEPFPGNKTDFHGCARYSVPIGQDQATVLCPEKPAAGRPWVLAPSPYDWDSAPVANLARTELELVKRGFHVVTLSLGNTYGAPDAVAKWDALYPVMTAKYGLAKQVALMGLSREGLAIARWAAANPGKVSCLYMDKAVCDFKSWPGGKLGKGKGSPGDWQHLLQLYHFKSETEALAYDRNPIDLLPKLAAAKVAILYLAGETDDAVPYAENGGRVQSEYKRLGGVYELIMHPGEGHHPHGSADPKPVVDFIERHTAAQSLSKPATSTAWRPVPGHIMTPWVKDVNPRRPLPEYPRPQLVRKDWVNLNGLWDYAIQPMDWPKPGQFTGKILVPYPVESALSGARKPLWKDERLWYRRMFAVPKINPGKRLLLNFGAVDWEAKVFINGKSVGEHRGGYDAFTFDITDAVQAGAENELVVAVFDATGGGQANGKQNYNKFNKAGGIAYTASSGIWQTVWLETVAAAHIQDLKLIPDVDASCLRVTIQASGTAPSAEIEIIALEGGKEVARVHAKPGVETRLPVPHARLWTPEDPFLYNLKVRLGDDEVTSYFGMRKIALGKDEHGFTTMLLNGKPVFQAGPLDQGFWPDGLYTAPTDKALRWDIAEMKRLGFNMVRKHIKVEPARWFYWCDKLGLLVWQDMPSGGGAKGGGPDQDAGPSEFAPQFESELRAMIEQHQNHPSVIMWVVFNEGWGQYDTARLTKWVKELDPSRLVNSASGWIDRKTGDLSDQHSYPGPGCPAPESARAAVLGEFGGLGLTVTNHTWVDSSWGYRGVTSERALTRSYLDLWRQVWQLKNKQGLCAAVYTQWTDIETEANGVYTYDRKRLKVDPKQVAAAHRGVFTAPTAFEVVVPTSQTEPASWRYTTENPGDDWMQSSFNDATWRVGAAGFGAASFTNAPVRTPWESEELWLRRQVVLPNQKLFFPALKAFHGQDVEVFLNGVLAAKLNGRSPSYEAVDINVEAVKHLTPGLNQLAVHCRRGKQIQFFDMGMIQERR